MRFWKRVEAALSAGAHSRRGFNIKALRRSFKAEARRAFSFLLTEYSFNEPAEKIDGLVFSNGSIEVAVEQDCIRGLMVAIWIFGGSRFTTLGGLVRTAGGRPVMNEPDWDYHEKPPKGRDVEIWADGFSVEFYPQSADLGEMKHLWPSDGKASLRLPCFLHNESRMREHLPRYALVLRAFADGILKGDVPFAGPKTPEEALLDKIFFSCQDETERTRLRKEYDERFGDLARERIRKWGGGNASLYP